MKKLFYAPLVVFFLLLFAFNSNVFAYTDGLLQDQSIYYGKDISNSEGSTGKWTDNDEATSLPLTVSSMAWYTFQGTTTIDSFKIKSNSSLLVTFYNENNEVISTYTHNSSITSVENLPAPVANVHTVAFKNTASTGMTIYELDVYNNNIVPNIPSAPTQLTALSNASSVDLTWQTGPASSTYTVKRSTSPGGPYDTIKSGIKLLSYSDSTVTPGKKYYYVVSGVNVTGESINSNEASVFMYYPGLLRGKAIHLGTSLGDTSAADVVKWTDGIDATSSPLAAYLNGWYEFNDSVTVKALELKTNGSLDITFYDSSKNQIGSYKYSFTTGDLGKLIILDAPIENVKYISFNNKTIGMTVYEFDVLSTIDFDQNPSEPNPEPEPQPEPSGDRAILTITMITGLEKEYDLSIEEIDAFLDWYDAKENGTGSAKFGFDKHNNNKGPFSKRTDYVIFDKILTFEVSEYTAE
ncbi:Amylopullulanase precursor [compost metagenome]